jgi:hypothetical protein
MKCKYFPLKIQIFFLKNLYLVLFHSLIQIMIILANCGIMFLELCLRSACWKGKNLLLPSKTFIFCFSWYIDFSMLVLNT